MLTIIALLFTALTVVISTFRLRIGYVNDDPKRINLYFGAMRFCFKLGKNKSKSIKNKLRNISAGFSALKYLLKKRTVKLVIANNNTLSASGQAITVLLASYYLENDRIITGSESIDNNTILLSLPIYLVLPSLVVYLYKVRKAGI